MTLTAESSHLHSENAHAPVHSDLLLDLTSQAGETVKQNDRKTADLQFRESPHAISVTSPILAPSQTTDPQMEVIHEHPPQGSPSVSVQILDPIKPDISSILGPSSESPSFQPSTGYAAEHSLPQSPRESFGDDISPTRRALADGLLRRKLEDLAQSNTSKGLEARTQLKKLQSGELSTIQYAKDDDPFGPGLDRSAFWNPKAPSPHSTPITTSVQSAKDDINTQVLQTPTRPGKKSPENILQAKTLSSDGMKAEISAENAQALLPPSSCVFVANLSQNRSDEELEVSVKEVFASFGTVYVKIRRDSRGMPFAFCQYESDLDAQQAIIQGRRTLIDGRPCRTEPARVNRSLYMFRRAGGAISEAEAREVLHGFGSIESTWYSSPTDIELYQLPEGIWVKFAYYQDCRDAQSEFRDNNVYRLEQPAIPSTSNRQLTNGRSQIVSHNGPIPQSISYDRRNPRSTGYRHSIFVGNLSLGTTNKDLYDTFSPYGPIFEISLSHRMESSNDMPPIVSASIDFVNRQSATLVLGQKTHIMLDGHELIVKLSSRSDAFYQSRHAGRISSTMPPTPLTTPGRKGESRPEMMEIHKAKNAFRRAPAAYTANQLVYPPTPQQYIVADRMYPDYLINTPNYDNFGHNVVPNAAQGTDPATHRYHSIPTPLARTRQQTFRSSKVNQGSISSNRPHGGYPDYYPPTPSTFAESLTYLNMPHASSEQHVYWMPQESKAADVHSASPKRDR